MTSLNVRLTGLVSVFAGIFVFSGGSIHYFFHNPFGHWIMYFGYILLVFALTGLYAAQARQTGLLGLAGYILSIIGVMIMSVSAFLILADVYGLKSAHDTWMFMYIDLSLYLPGLYALLLGMVLFGLATTYGGVFPRPAGLLLALAAVTDLPAELLSGMIGIYLVSVTLIMASLAWMGIYLLRRGAQPFPLLQPEARLSDLQ